MSVRRGANTMRVALCLPRRMPLEGYPGHALPRLRGQHPRPAACSTPSNFWDTFLSSHSLATLLANLTGDPMPPALTILTNHKHHGHAPTLIAFWRTILLRQKPQSRA